MPIPTQQSLHGVIIGAPRLTPNGTGPARFVARIEAHPTGDDRTGPSGADEPGPHDLVMFGPAAERAYAIFQSGDAFVASGQVDSYEYDGVGLIEEFVAEQIGHDATRTWYSVDRRPTRQPRPPVPSRDVALDPPSPHLGL